MKLRYASVALAGATILAACSDVPTTPSVAPRAASTSAAIGINVLLTQPLNASLRAQLETYGAVLDEIPEIKALTMRIASGDLDAVRALPFVAAASPDAKRQGAPVDAVAASDFAGGRSSWNLDAINVTSGPGNATRSVAETGAGVYVGILDSGLLDSWRQYFPEERVATGLARAFGGGGGEVGSVSEQPNKWEHDQNSHGTHVTSTVLGFNITGVNINGVAPMATVIPVKVLNADGWGWSSVIARGIVYITDLKRDGALGTSPAVINISIGGPVLDPVEKAAVEYAVSQGVIIVAAAGNEGTDGMSYPGAYAPVISAAASGWKKEFTTASWWHALDVPDPIDASDFFIAGFSSRKISADQDLDVAAPGQSVVGPYQYTSGQLSYYYLNGTSMASPHVAGIVALMAERKPTLTASEAEGILESTAVAIPGVPATVQGSGLATADRALAKLSTTATGKRK